MKRLDIDMHQKQLKEHYTCGLPKQLREIDAAIFRYGEVFYRLRNASARSKRVQNEVMNCGSIPPNMPYVHKKNQPKSSRRSLAEGQMPIAFPTMNRFPAIKDSASIERGAPPRFSGCSTRHGPVLPHPFILHLDGKSFKVGKFS